MKPKLSSLLVLSFLLSFHLAAQPPSTKAEVIPVSASIPEDAEIQKVIAPFAAEIKASFDLPLVQAPQGLFRGRRGEENLLGYWVSDVMQGAAEAVTGRPVRLAITNAGGLRSNLRPGLLKVSDIYELMESIVRRGGEPCSGVKAVVQGTPEAATLTITWADGSPIDPAAMVKVATSDYLYGGGDSIPTLKKGRKPFTTGLTLRQILLDECARLAKGKQDLVAPAPGRYTIPVPIQEAIRDKKFKL